MTAAAEGSVAVITGSAGLVGAEAVRRLAALGLDVVGVDNDQRRRLFGPAASTAGERMALERSLSRYRHADIDIREEGPMDDLFATLAGRIAVVIHAAAQPSHDWAARAPAEDFAINATATLALLERVRRHCPGAAFIYMSTNKVYGDRPNRLPLAVFATRYDVAEDCPYHGRGIDEGMGVDQAAHSVFGVSKLAADLMVQEYGRRFALRTTCLRAGCITGPGHRAVALHGFLAHLCATAAAGDTYQVVGFGGRQVRDILHVADLGEAFVRLLERPPAGAVYNIGGGPASTTSVVEALDLCGSLLGREVARRFDDRPRYGDHIWWVTDNGRFAADYPGWRPTRDVPSICSELLDRTGAAGPARSRRSRRVRISS
jgi:CDP-paratose 2-epimerase